MRLSLLTPTLPMAHTLPHAFPRTCSRVFPFPPWQGGAWAGGGLGAHLGQGVREVEV